MTLSRWLRDYVYISLGGNRLGRIRTYVNLMITMLLGGLWHGASWRFIIWGGLHGTALALHKWYIERKHSNAPSSNRRFPSIPRIGRILITFHFVCICWIFFRANSMENVGQMLSQILFSFNGQILFEFLSGYKMVMLLILIGFMLHFIPEYIELKTRERLVRSHFILKAAWMLSIIILVIQTKSAAIQPFIYFQF